MEPSVAIVHDYLVDAGGAERVVEAFHEQYTDAPIYTSVFDPRTTFPSFRSIDVRTSFLQRLHVRKSNYKFFLPVFPLAFESLNLDNYDIILSSASAFAKGVVKPPKAVHICYCHTPARFAWRFHEYMERDQLGKPFRFPLSLLMHYLRRWDFAAAQRVDFFISNSCATSRRIQENYRRDSIVISPPVDVERFSVSAETGDYYLVVSRLAPYKRIDIAIQAFNQLGLPLKIVGAGTDESRLRKMAGSKIEFLGHIPSEDLALLYARCRAVIFPGIEDFGIVPLEANASGRPVIAFAEGGALETIIPETTGIFFHEPTSDALARAIEQTDVTEFDPTAMRHHAEQFGRARFKERIAKFVQDKWNEWRTKTL